MDEVTNKTIREHETRTDEWTLCRRSEQAYTWFDRFNERFFNNKLQPPAISFERSRVGTLGHYVIGRNDFGLKWNININRLYLDRPLVDNLKTLLHEMTHQWEEEFGKRKSRGSYHSAEYRKKSRELGIPCNEYGMTLGYLDPFVSFLQQHGVEAKQIMFPKPMAVPWLPTPRGKSKLKKWSCGCTNVRVAVRDFRAKCLKCGNEFKLCR